jgi:hypothetical protein
MRVEADLELPHIQSRVGANHFRSYLRGQPCLFELINGNRIRSDNRDDFFALEGAATCCRRTLFL